MVYVKRSQEIGQSAKAYPKPLMGYENGKALEVRGGSVLLNSFKAFRKWTSRSVMLPPRLVATR